MIIVDFIREIHVELTDSKRRLCANSVSANFKITIDVADVVVVSVDSLLDDRVHVLLKGVDKLLLGEGTR